MLFQKREGPGDRYLLGRLYRHRGRNPCVGKFAGGHARHREKAKRSQKPEGLDHGNLSVEEVRGMISLSRWARQDGTFRLKKRRSARFIGLYPVAKDRAKRPAAVAREYAHMLSSRSALHLEIFG